MKIICLIVIFLSLYYPTNLNYQISFYEYGYNALVLSLYFDNEYKINNEDFIYYFEEQIKEENKYICKCKELSIEEIETLKKEYGLKTLKDIVKKTKAGTACGGCRNRLKELFKDNLR